MNESVFRQAAVIGTGMMGPGIAATLAIGAVETRLISRSSDNARRGLRAAREAILDLESSGLLASDRANQALERLNATDDLDGAAANADLVIESAPEDMSFKQDLFARLDRAARASCILASNTSGLSISAIASKCEHPERVLTTHFWNPPHLMPLVEIVKGEKTADAAVARVRELLRGCGKKPVVVHKDRPGQLGNRLQGALQREALYIVQEGIASAEDVDLAARCGFGLRLPAYGIFEHMDLVGLDLLHAVSDYVSRDLCDVKGALPVLREKLRQGALGAATGEGFYDWSKKDAAAVRARRDAFLRDFLKRNEPGG